MARRTREQWLVLFQAQVDSGLSASEFCRQQGIDPNYFFQRKGSLGPEPKPVSDPGAGFVELRAPAAVAGAVELRFGPVSLSLPPSASPGWVAAVMRELAGATV